MLTKIQGKALRLKKAGKTQRQIADTLGCNRSNTNRLLRQAHWQTEVAANRPGGSLDGLRNRTMRTLAHYGISTHRQICTAYRQGKLGLGLRLRGYGPRTHKEVTMWAAKRLTDRKIKPSEALEIILNPKLRRKA